MLEIQTHKLYTEYLIRLRYTNYYADLFSIYIVYICLGGRCSGETVYRLKFYIINWNELKKNPFENCTICNGIDSIFTAIWITILCQRTIEKSI